MDTRSQSAIEFIMTYGWAIVAAVVALGIIYSLGIFSLSASGATGCVVIEGFSCTQPVMYSSGSLNVRLGQVGSGPKTITAVGCSQNSTKPSTWVATSVTLQSGQVQNFSFVCPGVQGSKLGSVYQRTLWIQYTASTGSGGGGGTVTQSVGSVKVAVSSTGVPGVPIGSSYVPITITNGQNATGANFQQQISFNPSTYSSYVSSDLGNIRFYQGSTELYSWCESGCTSASGGAVFWVKIPGGIGGVSNTLVYMAFESNAIEYDGTYAGEAPQLSSTYAHYAQYDNGATLFPLFYSNFAGNVLPASWTCISACSAITTSNGLTILDSNTLQPIEAAAYGLTINNTVGDAYMRITDPTQCSGVSCTEQATIDLSGDPNLGWEYQDSYWSWCPNGGSVSCPYPLATAYITTQQLALGTWGVASLSTQGAPGGYTSYGQLNYGAWTLNPAASCIISFSSCKNEIFFDVRNSNVTVQMQWVRLRTYPPSGVMPSASFGSISS